MTPAPIVAAAALNRTRIAAVWPGAVEAGDFALLAGGKAETRYGTDVDIPFRQESNFIYATGAVWETDCLVLLDVAGGRAHLLVPRHDPSHALWLAAIPTLAQLSEQYGVDSCVYNEEAEVKALLEREGCKRVFTLDSPAQYLPAGVAASMVQESKAFTEALSAARVAKQAHEMAFLRHASDASSAAHRRLMALARPGLPERAMEAAFLADTYANGAARFQAYTSICASGSAGATLHYQDNRGMLAEGDLFLIDAGCEYRGYASDITRTYPVSGKFTPDQLAVYTTVLKAQEACIAAVKPGVDYTDLHLLAEGIILDGLIEMGILKGDRATLLEKRLMSHFFPHGVGHQLGLDVHDVGGYPAGTERIDKPSLRYLRCRAVLAEGMCLTIEPGLYFISHELDAALADPERAQFFDAAVLARFRSMGGVRIEDNIVVTADGCLNLTTAPKSVADVEAACAAAVEPMF